MARISSTPEYVTWMTMKQRCYCRSHSAYKHYGAKGIKVCDRWRHSFDNFLTDMGERPSPMHSLDRQDGTKGYSPDNCRWATKSVQMHNRRSYGASGVRGVYWGGNAWRAQIKKDGRRYCLGSFRTIAAAAKAYRLKSTELYGDA